MVREGGIRAGRHVFREHGCGTLSIGGIQGPTLIRPAVPQACPVRTNRASRGTGSDHSCLVPTHEEGAILLAWLVHRAGQAEGQQLPAPRDASSGLCGCRAPNDTRCSRIPRTTRGKCGGQDSRVACTHEAPCVTVRSAGVCSLYLCQDGCKRRRRGESEGVRGYCYRVPPSHHRSTAPAMS